MLVRLFHGAARVLLRSAGGPADHLRDEIFEACRRNAMVGLVYPRVHIQARINHDPVDEIIYYSGDAVDATEALIKAGRILSSHHLPTSARGQAISVINFRRLIRSPRRRGQGLLTAL